MGRVARVAGLEHPQVVRDPDLRVRVQPVDHRVRGQVRVHQRLGGRERAQVGRLLPRRPQPPQVGVVGVDGGLVDGDPVGDEVTEFAHDGLREAQEGRHRVRGEPAAGVGEPAGLAEVVQGDQGTDAGVPQPGEFVAVVREPLGVELPAQGFDAGPLQAHPVVPDAELAEQGDVLLDPVPVVGGARRGGAVDDPAGRCPAMPRGVRRAALDLGRRGGDSQFTAGKGESGHGHLVAEFLSGTLLLATSGCADVLALGGPSWGRFLTRSTPAGGPS